MITADNVITDKAQQAIEAAIAEAEKGTSGEIRVHIDDLCSENPLDRAAFLFAELEMHKTDLRNGVLIYLSVVDRKMAIIGDLGIHTKVGQQFWDSTKELMLSHLRQNQWEQGICAGVLEAGKQLRAYFPISASDRNELPNTISRGKR